jgi:hypothetical protein
MRKSCIIIGGKHLQDDEENTASVAQDAKLLVLLFVDLAHFLFLSSVRSLAYEGCAKIPHSLPPSRKAEPIKAKYTAVLYVLYLTRITSRVVKS